MVTPVLPAPSAGGGEVDTGFSPLDAITIPRSEPLDKIGPVVRPKVKNLVDGIYHNPLTKALTAEIYERYPRPDNLKMLHKTRINEEVLEELDAPKINVKPKTVSRDAPYKSMQWGLQFAARPLVGVLQHLDEGLNDPAFIATEIATAMKLIARTSWRLNDMRRAFLKQNVGGPVLALTRENNTQGFEFLLGDNLREEVLSRTKVHETFKDMVVPLTGSNKPRSQGNSRAGPSRGRDRRNGYQGQRSNQQRHNSGGQNRGQSNNRGGRQGAGNNRNNNNNNSNSNNSQNRGHQRGGGNSNRSGGGGRRGGSRN
jgi:hypothetical protein